MPLDIGDADHEAPDAAVTNGRGYVHRGQEAIDLARVLAERAPAGTTEATILDDLKEMVEESYGIRPGSKPSAECVTRVTPGQTSAPTAHSWTPVRIIETAAEPPAPPTISGIAYPDRLHVWSGEPETLKSLVALILCVEEIRAGRCVLYLDFENGEREILVRLHELGLTDDQIDRGFIYIGPVEPMTADPAVLADVTNMIERRCPSLVVIDSYTASLTLHGCDPDKAVGIEHHGRAVIRPLREGGAAVVLLDHVVKTRENRGRYSIASERKIGVADVHIGFEVVMSFGRGRRGLVRLVTHKDRPGHLPRPKTAEIELASDPVTHAITWTITTFDGSDEVGAFRPTNIMEKVSQHLEQQSAAVSRKHVEDAMPHKAGYVRKAMNILVSEGFVRESPGARGALLLESVRAFHEHDLVPTSSQNEPGDLVPTSSQTEPRSHAS